MARSFIHDPASSAVLSGAAALAGCLVLACGGRTLSDDETVDSRPENSVANPAIAGGADRAPAVSGITTPRAVTTPGPVTTPTPACGPGAECAPSVPSIGTSPALEPVGPGTPLAWSENGDLPTLYTAKSPIGTTLELVETSDRICVRGHLDPVPDGDYANYWGAEVGFSFVQDAEEQAPLGAGVAASGFAFRLEGTLPPLLRLRVGAAGEVPLFSQYCQHVPLVSGNRIGIALEGLTMECWAFNEQPFPDGASAALVSWQIPAHESTTEAFDFCIEQIETLP